MLVAGLARGAGVFFATAGLLAAVFLGAALVAGLVLVVFFFADAAAGFFSAAALAGFFAVDVLDVAMIIPLAKNLCFMERPAWASRIRYVWTITSRAMPSIPSGFAWNMAASWDAELIGGGCGAAVIRQFSP